jgi:hypothetical protein
MPMPLKSPTIYAEAYDILWHTLLLYIILIPNDLPPRRLFYYKCL